MWIVAATKAGHKKGIFAKGGSCASPKHNRELGTPEEQQSQTHHGNGNYHHCTGPFFQQPHKNETFPSICQWSRKIPDLGVSLKLMPIISIREKKSKLQQLLLKWADFSCKYRSGSKASRTTRVALLNKAWGTICSLSLCWKPVTSLLLWVETRKWSELWVPGCQEWGISTPSSAQTQNTEGISPF